MSALQKLRYFFRRQGVERELEDEMRFHLEMEEEANLRMGKSLEDARRLARRSFGGVERYKDECREARGFQFIEDLKRDVRFATRTFARLPAVTAVTVVTLALGIGATTAIYGAVYTVLLAPLPYSDPDDVVTVWQIDRAQAGSREDLSAPNFLDLESRNQTVSRLAAAEPFSYDYLTPDGAIRFTNSRVTEHFFPILGTRPLLGRTFQPGDYGAGRSDVVVLSYRLWNERFGADSSLVGKTLVLDSVPRTVVGVMPRGFDVPDREDVWSPKIFTEAERQNRAAAYYTTIGRLRQGVPVEAATRDFNRVASQLSREYPRTNASVAFSVVPLPDEILGRVRRALFVLLGAVGCVLLIACANVANLQLTAAVRRQREFAIRTAIGAGRVRLIRQLLTESLLLAVLGAFAGIILAQWGIEAIRSVAPSDLPRIEELRLGGAVLSFGLALTVVTALLFGIAPMVRATRLDLQQNLAAESHAATTGMQKRRLGSALVIAEVALAFVLLVGAGLLAQSFSSLLHVDRGFRAEGVTVATMQAWSYYPTPATRAAFVKDATSRLATIPGVERAAMTSSLPLSDRIGQESSRLTVEGVEARKEVRVAATSPEYFSTLRIPLRRGRTFGPRDDSASVRVAIVNEALAREYWPAGDAIGRRITFAFAGPPVTREVVGVVGNVRHDGLHADPSPTAFIPHAQAPTGAVRLVVRAKDGDAARLIPSIQRELNAMNRAMPVTELVTLESLLDTSLRERRFNLALLGAFAIAAVILAAVGIYGVISSVTSERTHEIGIRVALGADARAVLAMVLLQGLKLAATGVVIGLLGATIVTRLLEGMLFDVTPLDPAAFLFGVAVLLGVAALACLLPASRAARLDAARALRQA